MGKEIVIRYKINLGHLKLAATQKSSDRQAASHAVRVVGIACPGLRPARVSVPAAVTYRCEVAMPWMSVDPEAEVVAATARTAVAPVITLAVLRVTRLCESPSIHRTR